LHDHSPNTACIILNAYPITIIPDSTIKKNTINNLVLHTPFNMAIEGIDVAVTPIINAIMVPTPAPLTYRASAIGMVPKYLHILAYR